MPLKEIRFTHLVKESGKPEVVTLWGDPGKDADFMRLVKAGKILTLIQKPTGNKKDFGLVGFHPQPFAAYLVFPKRLKSEEGEIVIGIKYDQLAEASGKIAGVAPSAKKSPVVKKKPEPVANSYEVKLRRTGSADVALAIKAFTANEAKIKAMAETAAEDLRLVAEQVHTKVVSVQQKD